MFCCVIKQGLRFNQLPPCRAIDEQYARVEIIVFHIQAYTVDTRNQFRFARVCRSRKKMPIKLRFPQWAQRINHQDIRVQIEHALNVLRQQVRGQHAIIHFLWVLLGYRRSIKQRSIDGDRSQRPSIGSTALFQESQILACQSAMHEINVKLLTRIVQPQRG